MSPEQARAEELNARTDLFSFGAVLYEMATGKHAFSGNSPAVIFSAILERSPSSAVRLNPKLPGQLELIIGKALEKDRARRYQTASDLRSDLSRIKRGMEAAELATMGEPSMGAGRSPDVLRSIAVLPFENASGDADPEYLCDGITESIINSLSRIPTLRVIPRSTVF